MGKTPEECKRKTVFYKKKFLHPERLQKIAFMESKKRLEKQNKVKRNRLNFGKTSAKRLSFRGSFSKGCFSGLFKKSDQNDKPATFPLIFYAEQFPPLEKRSF